MRFMETTPDEPRSAPDVTLGLFEPGTLWRRTTARTRHALSAGVLAPIETESHVVEEAGIPFSVRLVSTLREKERSARGGDSGGDPFLPPDPDLLVAGVSRTHVAVLNRFPVLRNHLLVVTREHRNQELPLTAPDFDALARCLAEIDGLAFFNSHPEAGASQSHRHLQLVPFPVGSGPAPTPIDGPLTEVLQDPGRSRLAPYPFLHAVAPVPATAWEADDPARRGAEALRLAYRALAGRVGLELRPDRGTHPYNLLATRRWMLLVPRAREGSDGVSVNALGFAGSLLVKDREHLATVRRHGPVEVLRRVAVPL